MKLDEIRTEGRRRTDAAAGRRARVRVNPRLAGALDALKGDETPADRRGPIPFDGPERLAYWRGKREAEQYVERARESLGRTPAARDVSVRVPRAVKRTHDSPNALPRPMRGAVPPARAGAEREAGAAARSRLRTEVGR